MRTVSEMFTSPLPPPVYLMPPLLIEKDTVVIAGEPSAGKSFFLIDLGLHLAAGKEWLGFRIPKPVGVMLFDLEMSKDLAEDRIRRFVTNMDIPFEGLPFVRTDDQEFPTLLNLGNPHLMTRAISQHIAHAPFQVSVVMFDTARGLLGALSENKQEVVRPLFQTFRPLKHTGLTCILSHHFGKPGEVPRNKKYRVSGSTDWVAASDMALSIEEGQSKNMIEVEVLKHRNMELGTQYLLRRVIGPQGVMGHRLHDGHMTGRPPDQLERAIAYVTAHPDATYQDASQQGISKNTFYRAKEVFSQNTPL